MSDSKFITTLQDAAGGLTNNLDKLGLYDDSGKDRVYTSHIITASVDIDTLTSNVFAYKDDLLVGFITNPITGSSSIKIINAHIITDLLNNNDTQNMSIRELSIRFDANLVWDVVGTYEKSGIYGAVITNTICHYTYIFIKDTVYILNISYNDINSSMLNARFTMLESFVNQYIKLFRG